MSRQSVNATLDMMKAALAGGDGADFAKAFNVAFGLTNYDLEPMAKLLFPWGDSITPLRNEIERRKGNGDVAHHWKSITAINTGRTPLGVSEGNRGGVIASTEQDRLVTYAGLGLEDFVTYEAQYASEGFDDVLALASQNLLKATMIGEEQMIIGGNASVLLGTPTTPTLTQGTTGGLLSDATYYVGVVALSADGYARATVAGGIVQQINRTNADGSSDTINGGTSKPSAVANIVVNGGGATEFIGMVTPAIKGAAAYAWYISSGNATHQYLAAITTINSFKLTTAVPANTFQDFGSLAATDNSNTGTGYGFDGILYGGPFGANTNSYYVALANGVAGAGTQMTTDNSGGVTEINALLKDRYDLYRLSPDTIWCNSQEIQSIKTLVVKNGGAPLIRFSMDANKPIAELTAGTAVGTYLNPYTNTLLRVRVHPFQTPGTMLFTTKEAPYVGSRVSTLLAMFYRQEYYSTLWPARTRKREYGVYVDEVLANYFPPAFAAITNIAPTTS